jgi:hypothetical protein
VRPPVHPDPPSIAFDDHERVRVHGLRSGFGALSPLLTQQTGRPLLKRRRLDAVLASRRYDVMHFHNISLLGPDIEAFNADEDTNPKDAQGRDWLREFLRANGDMVDMVTVHRFPFPLGDTHPPPKADELFADAPQWTPMIQKLRAIVREEVKRDLPVGIEIGQGVSERWSFLMTFLSYVTLNCGHQTRWSMLRINRCGEKVKYQKY